jgi:putative transcriptional regulator
MPKAVIHNTVRFLRHTHGGMTQQELADRIGCTRQTVILLEQERYVPSLALALRIARVFEMTVDDIFTLEPAPQEAPQRTMATRPPHDPTEAAT